MRTFLEISSNVNKPNHPRDTSNNIRYTIKNSTIASTANL